MQTGEAIAAERGATRREERLNVHTPCRAVKFVSSNSVSRPSRMDSAPSPSSSGNGADRKADHRRLKYHIRSCRYHRRQEKYEKCSSIASKLSKSDESSSDLESDSDSSDDHNRKIYGSMDDGPKVLRSVNSHFSDALD